MAKHGGHQPGSGFRGLGRRLPATDFASLQRTEVRVGKTPYIRFDRNDYSVPYDLVCRQLVVFADTETVRIVDNSAVVAEHSRSFDRDSQIENPSHIERLQEHKREAHLHRSQQLLLGAVPKAQDFLAMLALHGGNLGSAVAALL